MYTSIILGYAIESQRQTDLVGERQLDFGCD